MTSQETDLCSIGGMSSQRLPRGSSSQIHLPLSPLDLPYYERVAPPIPHRRPPPLAPYVCSSEIVTSNMLHSWRGPDPRTIADGASVTIRPEQGSAPPTLLRLPLQQPSAPVEAAHSMHRKDSQVSQHSQQSGQSHLSGHSEHSIHSIHSSRSDRSSPSERYERYGYSTNEALINSHSATISRRDLERPRRTRVLMTRIQSSALTGLWKQTKFPSNTDREYLAGEIGLTARQVQVWFQNQRQKYRRQTLQSGGLPDSERAPDDNDPWKSPRIRRLEEVVDISDRISQWTQSSSSSSQSIMTHSSAPTTMQSVSPPQIIGSPQASTSLALERRPISSSAHFRPHMAYYPSDPSPVFSSSYPPPQPPLEIPAQMAIYVDPNMGDLRRGKSLYSPVLSSFNPHGSMSSTTRRTSSGLVGREDNFSLTSDPCLRSDLTYRGSIGRSHPARARRPYSPPIGTDLIARDSSGSPDNFKETHTRHSRVSSATWNSVPQLSMKQEFREPTQPTFGQHGLVSHLPPSLTSLVLDRPLKNTVVEFQSHVNTLAPLSFSSLSAKRFLPDVIERRDEARSQSGSDSLGLTPRGSDSGKVSSELPSLSQLLQ